METHIRSFRVEIETPEDDAAKPVRYHREALLKVDGETGLGGPMVEIVAKILERPDGPHNSSLTVPNNSTVQLLYSGLVWRLVGGII